MWHRKWRETKQQPHRAWSGHQISCCLVSLWGILSGRPVGVGGGQAVAVRRWQQGSQKHCIIGWVKQNTYTTSAGMRSQQAGQEGHHNWRFVKKTISVTCIHLGINVGLYRMLCLYNLGLYKIMFCSALFISPSKKLTLKLTNYLTYCTVKI